MSQTHWTFSVDPTERLPEVSRCVQGVTNSQEESSQCIFPRGIFSSRRENWAILDSQDGSKQELRVVGEAGWVMKKSTEPGGTSELYLSYIIVDPSSLWPPVPHLQNGSADTCSTSLRGYRKDGKQKGKGKTLGALTQSTGVACASSHSPAECFPWSVSCEGYREIKGTLCASQEKDGQGHGEINPREAVSSADWATETTAGMQRKKTTSG